MSNDTPIFHAFRPSQCRGGLLLSLLILPCLLLSGGCRKAEPEGATAGGAQRPPTQVVALSATRKDVVEKISLVGTLMADEMVEIRSETDGIIQTIGFEEGQPVDAGDLLVQLDETKFSTSLEESQATQELTRTDYERSQQLASEKLISKQEYDQAESRYQAATATVELRKRNLEDSRILAPFSGIVGSRSVSPGQVISRNTTLTWLVDLDPVKVEVNVPERFLSQLEVAQVVEIRLAAYPGEVFQGQVYFIAPFVDPTTRTALIKARIENPDLKLKPGMFASLDLTLNTRNQSIVIPESAIAQIVGGGKAMVYVIDENQTAQLVPVVTGVRMPGEVEILEGLETGQSVIIEGIQKIGPNAPVAQSAPETAESREASQP